jgi:hypothetical protein
MASYFERLKIPASFAFAAMFFGWSVSTVWLVCGQLSGGEYFFSIEPMYPGLCASVGIWGAGRIFISRKRR